VHCGPLQRDGTRLLTQIRRECENLYDGVEIISPCTEPACCVVSVSTLSQTARGWAGRQGYWHTDAMACHRPIRAGSSRLLIYLEAG